MMDWYTHGKNEYKRGFTWGTLFGVTGTLTLLVLLIMFAALAADDADLEKTAYREPQDAYYVYKTIGCYSKRNHGVFKFKEEGNVCGVYITPQEFKENKYLIDINRYSWIKVKK